jgi:RNA polymerase sigma-70 factor (ECF subfamily)
MGGSPQTTTRWSLVLTAAVPGSEGFVALSELCGIYWDPLYAFVRHDRRRSAADAEELTQEFCAEILARNDIAKVDRARGRFRDWLLQSLRHFLFNQADRRNAKKRGGGVPPLSLDFAAAERRYQEEAADHLDPEKLYTRRWTKIAVGRALTKLRAGYTQGDERKGRVFDALEPSLLGEPPGGGYRALAASLGTTAGALRTTNSRLREQLRKEVAETMALGDDVDSEIEELILSLA